MSYKHILFATDLSDTNQTVVDGLRDLTKAFNAELSVIHVVVPLHIYTYSYLEVVNMQEQIEQEAESNLAKFCERLDVPAANQILVTGPTQPEILAAQERIGADLVVVASHGHSGLGRFLGSTSNSVLNHADCDVLVLRAS